LLSSLSKIEGRLLPTEDEKIDRLSNPDSLPASSLGRTRQSLSHISSRTNGIFAAASLRRKSKQADSHVVLLEKTDNEKMNDGDGGTTPRLSGLDGTKSANRARLLSRVSPPSSGVGGDTGTDDRKIAQSFLNLIGTPDHSGWMKEKGGRFNSWSMRYFVLKGRDLYCLKSDSQEVCPLSFLTSL
jgi:hypothetical protein